ncbi:MAG: hypothetical protein ACTSUE_03760, partial [Promethearchaeota archaeon]
MVCKRWNILANDHFLPKVVAPTFGINEVKHDTYGILHEDRIHSEYSNVEIGYFQSVVRILGSGKYINKRPDCFPNADTFLKRPDRFLKEDTFLRQILDVCISFPRKHAGDYLVKTDDGKTPLSTMEWFYKNGALRFILGLFYIVRRDDSTMLHWLITEVCKTYPKRMQIISTLLINLLARFSAKKCMNVVIKNFLFEWTSGVPFDLWRNMLIDASVFNKNLKFLQHVIGPKNVNDPKFFQGNKTLLRNAEKFSAYEIIRWLDKCGLTTYDPVSLFRKVLEDGDVTMTKWLLENKMTALAPSIYNDLSTSKEKSAQPWMFDSAVRGMNPDIIKTLRKFMHFGYGPSQFYECCRDRYGHTAEEHIRMITFLLEDLPLGDALKGDAPYRIILLQFANKGWIKEIKWLKDSGKCWINVKEALRRNDVYLFEWYLDQLGVKIADYWCTESAVYHKLSVAGRVDIIARLYEDYGFKRPIGNVIPGAMMQNNINVLNWLWGKRDELC